MSDPVNNGILNISKEAGYTSFDVVAVVRGIYHQKKVGHTGTLDPMATGVLPVALGKGTKVCGMITDWDKEYIAELLLGRVTDTLDVTGTTEGGDPGKAMELSRDLIEKAVMGYLGDIDQIPPMYSALKSNGQRLYDIARSGKTVERKPRRVSIKRIEILSIELPVVRFKVHCSKGTYIRSLCDDIGRDLGCGGCMQSLVRSCVGPFDLESAHSLDELRKLADEGRRDELISFISPVDTVFADHPQVTVSNEADRLLLNGNKLTKDDMVSFTEADEKQMFRVYHPDGEFAAVYEYDPETGIFAPYKMF
ncbi:MAG: tRNA pseudouridine(55) synthase TruB [Lachnospiraceae bacterium]|nr:tRNA pseudouridine(55) synthase TruB [Lachnospiraceae bacterium]